MQQNRTLIHFVHATCWVPLPLSQNLTMTNLAALGILCKNWYLGPLFGLFFLGYVLSKYKAWSLPLSPCSITKQQWKSKKLVFVNMHMIDAMLCMLKVCVYIYLYKYIFIFIYIIEYVHPDLWSKPAELWAGPLQGEVDGQQEEGKPYLSQPRWVAGDGPMVGSLRNWLPCEFPLDELLYTFKTTSQNHFI